MRFYVGGSESTMPVFTAAGTAMNVSAYSVRAFQTLMGLTFATSGVAAPDYVFGDGFEPGPIL